MRADNSIFEKEKREQSNWLVFFWIITGAGAGLILYAFGWTPTTFVIMPIWFGAALTKYANIQKKFQHRLTLLAFQNHIGNLYVVDKSPEDETTIQRRDFAIAMLKESGNEHGVRVYSILFRDVVIFCHWWNGDKLQMSREFRNEGFPATESWEQYIDFLNQFRDKCETQFMRNARKDSTGDDWLNQNFFKQSAT